MTLFAEKTTKNKQTKKQLQVFHFQGLHIVEAVFRVFCADLALDANFLISMPNPMYKHNWHRTELLYMRVCNGVDENFQVDFVISIGYCITEACIMNCIVV